jgi:hypothetical protein
VRTGALLWKFDLVAQPPDPANKTWRAMLEGDCGTNTWGYLSVDEQRGIVPCRRRLPAKTITSDVAARRQPTAIR